MSILKPGPGDLLDRAVILGIKVPKAQALGLSVEHLEEERTEIDLRFLSIRTEGPHLPSGRLEGWVKRLREIHERLWGIIDALPGEPDDHVAATLGRTSIRLNDERSKIVQEINRFYDADRGVEKLR